MEMNNHEIAAEILRRMELEKKRRAARKRKIFGRLAIAACLVFVTGVSVGVPLLVSDERLQESAWTHAASLTGGDPVIGLVALIAVCIIVVCCAAVLYRRKKRGRGYGKDH